MKEQIDILVRLNKIETETERIQSSLNQIPERVEMLDERLRQFQTSIEQDEMLLDELRKKNRTCESEVKQNTSNLEKNKEKLSSVKTNKEYQAMLKTIDDIREKNVQIEDQMLACLVQIEELENAIKTKKSEFAKLKNTITAEKDVLEAEAERGKERLAGLERECREVTEMMDSSLRKMFFRLKNQIRGAVVAPVTDAICGGCKLRIPAQMYNELQRRDRLEFCPQCQRIIYWEQSTIS